MTLRPFSHLLLIALFLEMGLVLVLIPWSVFWERNFFLDWLPGLETFVKNHFVRGAVSGLGVVNICVGFVDLATLMRRRFSGPRPGGDLMPNGREEGTLRA
ncbi:MAG: hypothetical protein HYX76_12855 [Acidobacteria bacterium]|nr:hypothetical protein [Acidobacteriota bacterium]